MASHAYTGIGNDKDWRPAQVLLARKTQGAQQARRKCVGNLFLQLNVPLGNVPINLQPQRALLPGWAQRARHQTAGLPLVKRADRHVPSRKQPGYYSPSRYRLRRNMSPDSPKASFRIVLSSLVRISSSSRIASRFAPSMTLWKASLSETVR